MTDNADNADKSSFVAAQTPNFTPNYRNDFNLS